MAMVNGNGVGYKQASEAILLVGYMTNCEFICLRMSPTASITSQVPMDVSFTRRTFSFRLRILICVISLTVMAKWRGDKFIVFPGRGDKRPVGHFSSELTNHLREKHFSQNLLVQN